MKHRLNATVAAFSVLMALGLAPGVQAAEPAMSLAPPKIGTWGFEPSSMDPSVKPGDNFYLYSSGTYLKNLTIDPDKQRAGVNDQLQKLVEARQTAILQDLMADTQIKAGSEQAKILAAYRAYMDEDTVNSLGAKPIAAELSAIAKITSKADYLKVIRPGEQFGLGVFDLNIETDDRDPRKMTVSVSQGGLGLPNRDFYLLPEKASQRVAYQAYIAQMLNLIGYANADDMAKKILALETRLAEAQWSAIENREPEKTYHRMTVAELQAHAPGFAFADWIKAGGLKDIETVVVRQDTAFPKLAAIFADADLETLKARESFAVADQAAPYLSNSFDMARWTFRSKTLNGALDQSTRHRRALGHVNDMLGFAIGHIYVDRYLAAGSKEKMLDMVANIRAALRQRIIGLDWMGEATKGEALKKLDAMSVKVAYPDKWRDYSKLDVASGDLMGNVRRAYELRWNKSLQRLKTGSDRSEWFSPPQTVNAFYSPERNEIVFPAGYLQAPYFDPTADDAINYGGIGTVIGHEITHGFDDQGRKYAADGRLRNWWTDADSAKFDAKAKVFGEQYDSYEPLPGQHIQGRLTMGENIADLGGTLIALEAYHLSLKGKSAPVLDGFSGDQRFFLSRAQVRREKYRDEARKNQLRTDPHSPGEFRVIGPMRNMDSWYSAFGVTDGKYYLKPEDRVKIW